MNVKVDFDNIVVKEDKNDFNVKVLMLKGEKGDGGGEDNVIEKVQVNGTDLPVTNKTVNVSVPVVDSTLSSSSTNPVQNNTIYNALSNKVDTSELDNYYEISEVDGLLNDKVDNTTLDNYYTENEVYNKTETDGLLNNKANTSDINEINSTLSNKANKSEVANTYETITDHNSDINALRTQITGLASGSPLVASSTSEMTDTTRVYVNTTDGHWYYYDGTSWADGGVYQATSIASNSVDYDKLSLMIKNDEYDEIHANDVMWVKGYSYSNGSWSSSTNNVSSTPFILPKGNTIAFNNSYKGRVTVYDLEGNYVSNTGSYTNFTYTATSDCIVVVSVQRPDNSTSITEDECNNTNITFTGIIKKETNQFNKTLTFTQLDETAYYISNPFYVTAGSEISLTPDIFKISGSYNNGYISFGVLEENIRKSLTNTNSYQRSGKYIATQSGMVRLSIRFYDSRSISAYSSKIHNIIYVKSNMYANDRSLIYLYSTSNGAINMHTSDGKLYLNLGTDIVINKYNKSEYTIDMNNLESTFPSNIQTIDGVKYFFLSANNMLYYDLSSKTLKINSITELHSLYGDNTLPLMINKSANFCGGAILPLYLKYSLNKLNDIATAQDIFNSVPYGAYDWQTVVKGFNRLYNNKSKNIDTFVFFTDPHLLLSSNNFSEDRLITYLNPLEKIYNSIPVEFMVCGGDWLNDSDNMDIACFKLGYIDGFMNAKFKNYYPIFGNHDSNYQGKETDASEVGTGTLTDDTIINLMFSKHKNKYYSFKGNNNMNYVLDTGIDWTNTMTDYRWGQVDWLANKLIEDDPSHSIVYMHIVWLDSQYNLGGMVNPITNLINAFNNHTSITLNSITYDFTNATGHVDYVLSGHTHFDYNDTINNVLCVATTKFNEGNGTYDIIINDYDNNKLIMYRVGTGNSREFDI